MTALTSFYRRARSRGARVAVAFGVSVLAAASIVVTAGTGIAAAETPEEILNLACNDFEPNPDPYSSPPRVSNCVGATLTDANLTGANLDGANLTGAYLTGANLTGAYLNYANLNNAHLNGVDLSGADLSVAFLAGAGLYYADLTGATLTGANLTGVDLNRANLTGTSALPSDVTVPATSTDGAPATWAEPTMPTGLTFVGCDHASGTVLPVGPTSMNCTVTSLWQGAQTTGYGTFTVTVARFTAAPVFADTAPVTLSGIVGTELPHTFTVTGTPDPQVTVSAGVLPAGLSLSAAGVLSGAPTTAGPIKFTITAANGTAPDATLQVNGAIDPAVETPAQIITRVCGNYVANPTPDSVTDCSGRDLTGANLAGANLTGADLSNTTLTGAILTGVDLTHANLTGATLEGANLTGVILTGAILTGTSAIPADITGSAAGAPTAWTTPTMPAGLTFGGCTPASGTVFPVGATVVTCTVTSVAGDVLTTGTGTFTVTVTPVVDPPVTGSLGSLGSIFGS